MVQGVYGALSGLLVASLRLPRYSCMDLCWLRGSTSVNMLVVVLGKVLQGLHASCSYISVVRFLVEEFLFLLVLYTKSYYMTSSLCGCELLGYLL